ncbi:MAG: hypothetical protein AAF597_04945, partial [Bacteroidota bacterium]
MPAVFSESLHRSCPSAADSLGAVFYARSIYFNQLGNGPKAIEYGEYTLEQLHQTDTVLALGKMTYNLGFFHLKEGDLRSANWYFSEASRLFPLIDHPQSKRRWLQSMEDLGLTYTRLGDFQRAEETLLTMIREAEAVDNVAKIAHGNLKLGDLYLQQEAWGAAAGALEVAEAKFAEIDDSFWCNSSRLGLVGVALKRDSLQQALVAVNSLLRVDEATFFPYDRSRLYSLATSVSTKLGAYTAAEAYFQENLVYAQAAGYLLPQTQAYNNGGELALAAEE